MIKQSGIIPWRFKDDGLEILVITSRATGQWCVPKGWIEEDLTPWESAEKEGFEEAGVRGKVSSDCADSYEYHKKGKDFIVDLYPLEVVMITDFWPESVQRRRRWISIEDVDIFIQDKGLAAAVARLPEILPSLSK